MELSEYRKDYLESVKSTAVVNAEGTVTTFMKVSCDNLVDIDIITDYELCFYSGATKRGKKYRVDGYAFDEYDCSMSLFIADYSGEELPPRLTKSEACQLFERLYTFLDESVNGRLKTEMEISTPAYDLVERLNYLLSVIRKFKLFIITDKEMSETINKFPFGAFNSIPAEYHIWDIKRFYRALANGDGHEAVEIDFTKYTKKGIPCLEVNEVSNEKLKCYLCVLSGNVLADIYDEYGSRLLEGNVRSFLTTKVAVNKNIRTTILGDERNMFFAYNNGIAATASEVLLDNVVQGRYIVSIKNLQIVNGGQTTASLSNARFRDKASLEGIFVQMKLTEIKDHELAQKIIPNISKFSNSQNKVSDADFFSNHEFNIRMQKISRRLYAPAVNGAQYETHWFFERSRGQYEQEQAKLTPAEKKKYQLQNPKSQLITKTDFAKVRNSWRGYPYHVSMGAQKNFAKFAQYVVAVWEKNPDVFNELYFQHTISLTIIFKYLEKMILKQSWYEQGYRANIVTYSLALLKYLIDEQYGNKTLDLQHIWNRQCVPEVLESQLIAISKHVFDFITDEKRVIVNVTEWCKKEQCWIELRAKPFMLSKQIESCLIYKIDEQNALQDSKKEQRMVNGIEAQKEVISLGSEYWLKMLAWGKSRKLLSDIDISFIMSATKMNYGRIPSQKQCQRLRNIHAKMKEEGFMG